MLWMVAMIQQDRNLGNVHRFRAEIVDVVRQHFNESSIIRNVCFRAVRKERKAQRIDCQMPFDTIGRFVKAKSFRLDTRIAGVLHRL